MGGFGLNWLGSGLRKYELVNTIGTEPLDCIKVGEFLDYLTNC